MNTLSQLLAADPKVAKMRKKAAKRIAAQGAQDVTHRMNILRERKQYQASSVRFLTGVTNDVPGTYREAANGKKRNKVQYIPDTTVHATIPIEFTQAGIARARFGGYDKSPTHYYNEYCAGRMTRTAFTAFVAVVTLEVIREEEN
jgi:hypothetical protein